MSGVTSPAGLRRLTREKLALGSLPIAPPQRLVVGAGRGALCALCGLTIDGPEPEYELHFGGDPDVPRRFHPVCHTIWDTERRK